MLVRILFVLTFAWTFNTVCSQESPKGYLIDLYQQLHAQPELSFQEAATSARMAAELRKAGFDVQEQVGGYGVVGVLNNGEGPTLMIRADMDALPIVEETGLPYASQVVVADQRGAEVGVMHACGHDVHMTVLVGTARAMAADQDSWSGTLICIAQPAEERSGGAKAMLADGLYRDFPVPDYALALHVDPTIPSGHLGFTPGYAMANVDMMDITVTGRGGHGANPESTIDPVVLAARIVLALQTIVSRELSPLEPAVVTVGSIHGGSKGNIIPDEVQLELTMRSYSDEVREAIIEKIGRICRGEAIAADLKESQFPKLKLREEYTPSLYNDPDLTQRLKEVWEAHLGEDQLHRKPPKMVGEDFGRYGRTPEEVPICMFHLGTSASDLLEAVARGEKVLPALHTARYAPDAQKAISTGVQAMVVAAKDLLKEE